MNQDPIAAIGRANTDPLERYRAQIEPVDMQKLDTATPGTTPASSTGIGGAFIQPTHVEASAPSAMNLQSLAGQFSDGLQHGFYSADIDRLMGKLVQARQPGSGVSFGDVTVELLNVQAKVGIADAFSKVSSKLAEGLQTMVVRQG